MGQAVLKPLPVHDLGTSLPALVVFLHSYGIKYQYAQNKQPAVSVLRRDGKLMHAITLGNLFRAEVRARFERTAGGNIFWLRSAWIDEARAELIVVGGSVFRRTVLSITRFSLNTGQVRVGGRDELVRA